LMARSSNSVKVAAWRRRVGRFEHSGLTVASFCEQEGVSTASFYRWRNRLADQQPTAGSSDARQVAGLGGVGDSPAFRPVRVAPTHATVSVQLPGGVRVEVPAENLDAVRVVLGELLRQDAPPNRGGSSC
jgi:hypothetical protein